MQTTELILQSLDLENFAGSETEHHVFDKKETNVSGPNGFGKSRLLKAFTWLLFDKNQDDKKDFNIKNTIHMIKNRQDSVVAAVILKNGEPISIKKIYREKWVKKQGSKTQEFSGHETEHFYNDVPVSKGDFKSKVDSLIPEEIFKMLTNVSYFNSLPWAKQREIITKMVPEVTDAEVAETNQEFKDLLASLKNEKTIAEFKTEIAYKKKRLKDDLHDIPVRIDQELRATPEQLDFEQLSENLKGLNSELTLVETKLTEGLTSYNQKNEAIFAKKKEINALKLNLQQIENDIRFNENQMAADQASKKRIARANVDNQENLVAELKRNGLQLVADMESVNAKLAKLREQFTEINASSFNFENPNTECPTCGHVMTDDEVQSKKKDLEAGFIKEKKAKLINLNEVVGPQYKKELSDINEKTKSVSLSLDTEEEKLVEFKRIFNEIVAAENSTLDKEDPFQSNEEYQEISKKIKDLENTSDLDVQPLDQSDLTDQKKDLVVKIDEVKKQLNTKDQIAAANKRIDDLKDSEETLSQQLVDLEKTEFTIQNFDKAKITAVESQINSKFEFTRFKLFEFQVNGAEVPICVAQIGDVPVSDANTASKIVCGLDIIKALSRHYGFRAPIFIDQRESCHEIQELDSQIINLIAVKGLKKLTFS